MSDLNDNNIQNQTSDNSGTEPQINPDPIVNASEPALSGAEIISGVEPAKKSITAILVTIIIIIAVLAGGCAAAYNFIPWVKNNVKMLVNDPEEYYAWVENENMERTAEKAAEIYDELTNSSEQDSQIELKANLETDAINALIEENTGASLSESGFVIPKDIILDGQGTAIDGYQAATVKLNADGTNLITANVYLKDGKYYYQIPELSSAYIAMDMDTMFENAFSEASAEMPAALPEADSESAEPVLSLLEKMVSGEGAQSILTDDELEELLVKYFDLVFTNIKDVELEKGVECEVDGVKTEYNQLTADIDEGCLYQIVKDVLKEARDDKTIINIVESTGAMTKDEYREAVNNLLDQLGEYNISGGEKIGSMNVYVDSNGIIKGRSFELDEDFEDEDFKIDYMSAKDGSDEAFEFNLMADGDGIAVTGNFKEKSDKKTGDAEVSIISSDTEEYDFNIHFNDLKAENEEKGYVSGELTLDLSSFGLGEIKVNLGSDGKSQEIATDLNINGTNYGTISLKYSNEKPDSVTAFSDSEKVYNYTDDGAEMEEYANSADIEGFLNNFTTVFGIDFNSLIGGGYTEDPFGETDIIDPSETVIEDDWTGEADIPESVEYDFSKIKFQINGGDVTFPAKIDGLLDKVDVDVDKVEAGYCEYFYSQDGSLAVYVENTSSAAAAPKDCVITGLSVTDESDVNLTVDGIGAGSKISDAVAKYGCKLTDDKNGYTYIEDTGDDNYNQITLFYYDGVIYEIDVDFY
ncbi:hypothetical protein [Porcipelethomonas sp.]|uniref:hypothetical protein n=1 Tax=Porcipelethomonas sp. TaxID=2981675 RepID=UPI003EF339CC